MFNFKKSLLDAEIIHVRDEMEKLDPSSEKYTVCARNLKLLCESKNENSIDSKTWALIVCNLGGIALVLWHENAHVITSKAFNLVKKVL